jgi:hypothetical protein
MDALFGIVPKYSGPWHTGYAETEHQNAMQDDHKDRLVRLIVLVQAPCAHVLV